jgi:2-amino-4-hydroxy-6-hydroxymethyldihydropteridine diphosphokinase
MSTDEMVLAYIGLGSNLVDPVRQVRSAFEALAHLPETQKITQSSLYRNSPLGPPQPDYINAVAALRTRLSPHALLQGLQTIEQQQGRIRGPQRWGPRTLDLDLLLYDDYHLQDPVLTLPHPGLYERPFVLYPLYECAPHLVLPNGQRLQTFIQSIPSHWITLDDE